MKPIDAAIDHRDPRSRRLFDRSQALELGATDRMIDTRLGSGRWVRVHAGVYSTGPPDGGWRARLAAAVLAAGQGAAVSHRAAFALWGLEGLDPRVVEITVPYTRGPTPRGVTVHRTRRRLPLATVDGIAVTTVERTLLDLAGSLPRLVVAKGLDHALRRELTTRERLWDTIEEQGGRGVRGSLPLRRLLVAAEDGGVTGSPAETELVAAMRREGIPDPVMQYEVVTADGRRFLVDFAWPRWAKGVEVDGLDAHAGAEALDRDLDRQNALMDAGLELRRFSARAVRRDPGGVARAIAAFLTPLL